MGPRWVTWSGEVCLSGCWAGLWGWLGKLAQDTATLDRSHHVIDNTHTKYYFNIKIRKIGVCLLSPYHLNKTTIELLNSDN